MAITRYIENDQELFEVYVHGNLPEGKRFQRRKRGIKTLKKAQALEFEFRHEAANLKEEKSTYKWEQWFEVCMENIRLQYQPSTVACYRSQLTKWIHPHWTGVDLDTITKSDVYDLIFNKCEGFKTQFTKRNILKMVKRIFQMAVEEGVLNRNPCTGITVRVSEVDSKVLTSSEVDIFLNEARKAHHRFYPVWLMALMALMTGMRSGELFALKWTDLDFDGRTISVSKSWSSKNGITPTKSRRSRVVPISEDLLAFLREHRMATAAEDDFVLPRLAEWEHGDQARVTREFCVGLGITSIKFHDLRATFITNLLARGESLARVMSMVGHSELKTTNGYLRKAGVDVQGGTDKLGYTVPKENRGRILAIVDRS